MKGEKDVLRKIVEKREPTKKRRCCIGRPAWCNNYRKEGIGKRLPGTSG